MKKIFLPVFAFVAMALTLLTPSSASTMARASWLTLAAPPANVQADAWALLQKAYQAHGADRLLGLKNMVRLDRAMYYDKAGKPSSSAFNQDAFDFVNWRFHTTGWGGGSVYIVQQAHGRTATEWQGFKWFEGKGTNQFKPSEAQYLLYRLENEITFMLGHLERITTAKVVGSRSLRGVNGTAVLTYKEDPEDPVVYLIADDGTVLASKDGTDFNNEENLEIYRDYRMVAGIKVNFEHLYPDTEYGDYLVRAADVLVNLEAAAFEPYFAIKDGPTRNPDIQLGLRFIANNNQQFVGFVVQSITPRGPAENAGIKPGDALVSLNGVNVEQADDLTLPLARGDSGSSLEVVVRRGTELLKFVLIRTEPLG
jgi:PDZ domain